MKKFIFFDLDDTLFDFHKAEHIALTKTLIALDLEPEEQVLNLYSDINAAHWKLLEQGKLTREQVKVQRYASFFETLEINQDPVKAARTYEKFLSQGHFYIDGAQELLQQLYKTYRLFLVSNGSTDIQRSRIASSDIERYFEGIFISEEVGYNKPDKAYFDACFSQIADFQKEKAVILGDSLSSDILGGQNAGITTVWFNPKHLQNTSNVVPDYEIVALDEFVQILKEM